MTEVVIADDTGKITLTLWDDQPKDIRDGEVLKIDNGYISLLRGHMRLNVGKYGTLSESDEDIEPSEELDMSEKEYENQYNNYGNNNRYRNNGGNRRYNNNRRSGGFDRNNEEED